MVHHIRIINQFKSSKLQSSTSTEQIYLENVCSSRNRLNLVLERIGINFESTILGILLQS